MNPDPEIDIPTDRGRWTHGSRAPWDPPRKPEKPGQRGGADRLKRADACGGGEDDMGRGAD